ncbi:MAG: hypothetical protein ABI721_05520 [Candidatus Dojkabacteria bacterium]
MNREPRHLISIAAFNDIELSELRMLLTMNFLSFNHVDGMTDCYVISINKSPQNADEASTSEAKFKLVQYLKMAGARSEERDSKGRGLLSGKTEIFNVLTSYFRLLDILDVLSQLGLEKKDILVYGAPNFAPVDEPKEI